MSQINANIRVLAALQGRRGLELARDHRPDLILLDINLPDMTGDSILWHLRDEPATRAIPVIVLSADATPRQMDRMLNAGASRYLTKPLDVARFIGVLREVFAGAEPGED